MSIGLRSRVGGVSAVLVVIGVIAACGSTGELPPESTSTTDAGARRPDSGTGTGEVLVDGSTQEVDAGKRRPKIDSGTGEIGPCIPVPATTACLGKCGNVDNGCGTSYPCGNTCGTGQLCDAKTNLCITPRSQCEEYGAECGLIEDDCGRTLPCGECGIDILNRERECSQSTYKCSVCPASIGPEFCNTVGYQCGTISRCNQTINCGSCGAGQACDAVSHVCTEIENKDCIGKCGPISSGDGGILNCPGCPAGQACGVGGVASVCAPSKPSECTTLGVQCGKILSQCGGTVDCGVCPAGTECRSNGTCGAPCVPQTCEQQGAECGFLSDGCGKLLNCHGCPGGVCNPNTNQCCQPKTCADYPARTCGLVADGCGGNITCNPCGGGQTCLANGTCCTRKTCADVPGQCGSISDSCGGAIGCGCSEGKSCIAGQCQTCTPRTCEANYAGQCGTFTNGCGGSITCECSGNKKCGGGGTPGFCGCVDTTTCPPNFVGPFETCKGTLFCSQ